MHSELIELLAVWQPKKPKTKRTFLLCLPVFMSLRRVCMISSLPVFLPVLRALRGLCLVLY